MPQVEGITKVVQKIDKLEDMTEIIKAMEQGCAVVEREAIKKAPKKSGELRRSITSKVEDTGYEIVGEVFTPLYYAPYVEYGTGLFAESGGRKDVPWSYKDGKGNWHSTKGQKPQPFMRPALAENRKEILESLKMGVEKK